MRPASAFIQANGLRFHTLDWGGDGQPVVLVHATGFVAGVWQPLAEALRAAGYHPIAYDQRGHGDSDKPPTGYSFDSLAEDLRQILAALELPTAVGIGHSGGATAVALRAADHPGSFDRAVLIEPIVFPNHDIPAARTDHADSMVNRTLKRRSVWPSRDDLFASYHTRPPFNTWRADILRTYIDQGTTQREDGQVELKCPPAIEARVYDNSLNVDPWPHLRRLSIPALIIRGEHSEPVGPNQGAAIRDALPRGELLTIPDIGHFVPMDRPEVVERAVLDFLARTRPAGGGTSGRSGPG